MAFPYKTILVLGATSGIGLALAEKFIAHGAHVIAVGRRQENLDELVRKHGKEKVSAVAFDITRLGEIEGFVGSIIKSHPTLDSVFLNSGIQRGLDFTKPESIDLDNISLEMTTNYISYIHLAKYLLPHLQSLSTPTSLIFTTSGLALVPITRCGNYCASKAALHHLIVVMREQMKNGPGNVKIIEIYPPAVQTELHDAKHQPDIKNGSSFGMPLDEFTESAWKGLMEGKDDIPVGTSERAYEAFEVKRREIFGHMVQSMRGPPV
ncbi:short-chain dehydrogenase oxidoreductase protein [Rutstroemia sp. NJR-2017a WRK4]|nr:short-chain dehydrogenase oxidoreductase protein [Rutstroemia sp. NJR-2017a WRK4]